MVVALSLMATPLAQAEPIEGSSQATALRLAALVATDRPVEIACHFNRTLDGGAGTSGISEIIVRVAFHAGWSTAVSAAEIASDVLAARAINTDELARTLGELLMIVDEFPSMGEQDASAKPMNGV